jgi:protein SCO1/2
MSLAVSRPAFAQTSMKPAGDGTSIQDSTSKKPTWLPQVGIDQNLGAQVPLDAAFKDDFGRPVTLGNYFGEGKTRPAILVLVYYGCPRLCTMVLNEMNKALTPMSLNVGSDFDIVVVSFDPSEGPELAAKKKIEYMRWYNRPKTDGGWHVLTGDDKNIRKVADSVGFRYMWDEQHKQFIHAGGIMVLTPQGQVSKYFYGTQYTPRDIKAALIEASGGKIGTIGDAILQYCFEYDPHTGRYSFAILRVVQVAGGLTVLLLGTFITLSLRRSRAAAATAATGAATAPATATATQASCAESDGQECNCPTDGPARKQDGDVQA